MYSEGENFFRKEIRKIYCTVKNLNKKIPNNEVNERKNISEEVKKLLISLPFVKYFVKY